jgi:Ax21 family sulfation-dependent quorum factor
MKRILLAALVSAALPLAAQAGDLSYSYLQGGYQATDIDGLPNAHGWGGAGSFALGPNFQLHGGWARQDFNNSNVSFDDWNLGGGFHNPINATTDLVANVDYRRLNINGFSGDIKTYSGEVGVRSALAPQFEGWALAGYEDGHNINGAVYGKLGAQYKFGKSWGLVGEAKFSKDINQYFIGPRISF